MRRTGLLIFLCVISFQIPTFAQSDCDIELEGTILRLVQAQRVADSGDDLTAASMISQVQAEIENMVSGCKMIELTEKYFASDESLVFSYPNSWSVEVLDDDVYIAFSSTELIELFDTDLPEYIDPGEGAIALQLQSLDTDTFDDIVADVLDDIREDFTLLGQMENSDINGRRYVTMSVSLNEQVSGRIGLIDYSDAELPAAVLVLGLGHHEELSVVELYTDKLLQSVQYPPRQ